MCPDKPFGEGLYWSGSFPSSGQTSQISPWTYGNDFAVKVYPVTASGSYVSSGAGGTVRISTGGDDCSSLTKDICCDPNYLGCNDGPSFPYDEFSVAPCSYSPQPAYSPPKLYGSTPKQQCGWADQFVPQPPDTQIIRRVEEQLPNIDDFRWEGQPCSFYTGNTATFFVDPPDSCCYVCYLNVASLYLAHSNFDKFFFLGWSKG